MSQILKPPQFPILNRNDDSRINTINNSRSCLGDWNKFTFSHKGTQGLRYIQIRKSNMHNNYQQLRLFDPQFGQVPTWRVDLTLPPCILFILIPLSHYAQPIF